MFKLFFILWRWRSSVNATLIFSSISQPHLSQTVRCGTSRQLATDTCDGGFVQTLPFPRCVVRVLALGIHTARSTRLGSLLARVCASGPLRDWETARRNSPTDLKHTQPPSQKQDRPDKTRKTVMHLTQQSSRHSTVPRLAPVCPTRLCVSSSVVLPCHVTRGIIHSFIHMPPWCVNQRGYACGCAGCACDTGLRTRVQRASQCVCCACGPFARVGIDARLSPSARRGHTRTPTLRVDTHPLQRPLHMHHPHHHRRDLSPTNLPGKRLAEDPRAPPLSAVSVSPLP